MAKRSVMSGLALFCTTALVFAGSAPAQSTTSPLNVATTETSPSAPKEIDYVVISGWTLEQVLLDAATRQGTEEVATHIEAAAHELLDAVAPESAKSPGVVHTNTGSELAAWLQTGELTESTEALLSVVPSSVTVAKETEHGWLAPNQGAPIAPGGFHLWGGPIADDGAWLMTYDISLFTCHFIFLCDLDEKANFNHTITPGELMTRVSTSYWHLNPGGGGRERIGATDLFYNKFNGSDIGFESTYNINPGHVNEHIPHTVSTVTNGPTRTLIENSTVIDGIPYDVRFSTGSEYCTRLFVTFAICRYDGSIDY